MLASAAGSRLEVQEVDHGQDKVTQQAGVFVGSVERPGRGASPSLCRSQDLPRAVCEGLRPSY